MPPSTKPNPLTPSPFSPCFPQPPRESESGYMLIAVVVMVALVLLSLAVAAPIVAKSLRREKEVESEHRAQQYVRAIRLYYRRLKSYPPSMEALEKSNNIRFLRQQYTDPLTGKADWRLIHVGEQKTTVKGFFGEPLGGIEAAGLGASLGSASSLGTGFGQNTQTGQRSSSSTIGTTSGLAAGFAGATIGSSTPGTTAIGSSTGSSGFGSGGLGQIMGVGSARSGASILSPNGQASYDSWEFLYDPRIEQMYAKSNILGGGIGSQSTSGLGRNANAGLMGATGLTGATGVTGATGSTGSTGVVGSTGNTGAQGFKP